MRIKTVKVVDAQAEAREGDNNACDEKMDENTITCVSKYRTNQTDSEFYKCCFTKGSYISDYWLSKKFEPISHFSSLPCT